jgi:hypothetical protein
MNIKPSYNFMFLHKMGFVKRQEAKECVVYKFEAGNFNLAHIISYDHYSQAYG